MYKVTVKNSDKYHNVPLGTRYCLTRKSAIKVANTFLSMDRDVIIEKIIRVPFSFAWSDEWEETKVIFEIDDAEHITARKANKDDF